MYNKYPAPASTIKRRLNGVPDYFDRRRDMRRSKRSAMYREAGVTIGGSGLGEAERVAGMPVTPSFFRVLRAQPLRGQLFTEQQAELGQDRRSSS